MNDSVNGSNAASATQTQMSVLGRIEAILKSAETAIVHDEKALVAFVKAELAKL